MSSSPGVSIQNPYPQITQYLLPSYNFSKCGISINEEGVICRCKGTGTFSLVYVKQGVVPINSRFYDKKLFLDLKSKKVYYRSMGFFFMVFVTGLFLLLLAKVLASLKDVMRRKTTIFEYIKFLVMWKMKIENQENDLIIMKEEMEMLNELRALYRKRAKEKQAIVNAM